MSDLVKLARQRIDSTQRTHWEGCERDHRECLIQRMADEIERLIALRRDDARVLERMRALIAEAEVLAEYGRDDGLRDWVDAGAWLSPGDRIVVQSLPPQVPNEHGHVLTTAALWKMYVEEPETHDEPRAGRAAAVLAMHGCAPRAFGLWPSVGVENGQA